ncbi:MAG: hypothetical protein DHS20C16_27380 [Phycisphaerae bacterium]|nr:MAG: hypothetical protein DHS20C16_27380 [Phycisphaerae bacterium]
MMNFLPMISDFAPDGVAVLANLDIDGFLTSQSFLTQLASAISAFLLSLFGLLLGGGTTATA